MVLSRRYYKIVSFLFFNSVFTVLFGQPNKQLWLEYMLNYPFANSYNLENSFTYSTVAGQPKWRAFDYNVTMEYSITPNVDLLGAGLVSYTQQTESENTLELRPQLGTKIHFTPHRRIQTRLLLRMEQRNFKNLETNSWQQVMRPRVRGEVVIPINQNSIYRDKLWYAMIDAEYLFTDTDVQERFANRFRLRVGAGYRLNYSLRFELLYMYQQSRDGIDESFSSNDHILRIRFKQFLRKSKPVKISDVGN